MSGHDDNAAPSQVHRRERALLEAARCGQIQRARRFLDAGDIDVDYIDTDQRTALHYAARNGHGDIVEALIAAKCDLDSSSRKHGTPLCVAASHSHPEVVKMLLEAGADAMAPGGDAGSALHAACRGGSVEIVDMLVHSGVPLDTVRTSGHKTTHGWYEYYHSQSLRLAAALGHAAVVERLLDLGADVNESYRSWRSDASEPFEPTKHLRRTEGLSLLHAACMGGNADVVDILIRRGVKLDVQPEPEERGKALTIAAIYGSARCVRLLLDAGASDDTKDSGITPLWLAVSHGNEETAEVLLTRGATADPSLLKTGSTPLFRAQTPAMIELLVKHGASLHRQIEKGITPLMCVAAVEGRERVIKRMVELGANANHQGSERITPLHMAIHCQHKANAVALLQCGADRRKLDSKWRRKLTALVGEDAKRTGPREATKSDGFLRRIVLRRKPLPSDGAPVNDKQDVKEDDEKTLCEETLHTVGSVEGGEWDKVGSRVQ